MSLQCTIAGEAHTVGLANLYEIFKDKIFMDASKTTKSTKILVLKSFRLYGSLNLLILSPKSTITDYSAIHISDCQSDNQYNLI